MSKKHFATRDFRDAGTERNFAAGEHVDVSESELANYRAAGLVDTNGPQDAEPSAEKPKRTRRSTKPAN